MSMLMTTTSSMVATKAIVGRGAPICWKVTRGATQQNLIRKVFRTLSASRISNAEEIGAALDHVFKSKEVDADLKLPSKFYKFT